MFFIFLTFFELMFLALGVSLPLMVVSEFWFFKNEISFIDVVYGLFENNEYSLCFLVAFFGILAPLLKIIARHSKLRYLDKLQLHKFAMLDIFLISFIVFASKFSSLFNAKIGVGFYFLLVSILLGFFQLFCQKYTNKN